MKVDSKTIKKLMVRCENNRVFEIDMATLEPKALSYYDAWCFSDPEPSVKYITHTEWCKRGSRLSYANN